MRIAIKLNLIMAMTACTSNAIAAFVESAIGPAIPGDASAVYFNPATLVLLPKHQLVVSGAYVPVNFSFRGMTMQNATRYVQRGEASSHTIYRLPAAYLSHRINDKFTLGLGGAYINYGKQNFPENSILRYMLTYNSITVRDLIPSLTYKANDKFSIGAGLDFEEIKISLNSVVGSPLANVSDINLINDAKANGVGAHGGILYMPKRGTLIGLAYHSPVHFKPTGRSTFLAPRPFISNNFQFGITMPASTVLSVDQYLNKDLGIISTIQYMQWSSIDALDLQNIALIRGGRNVIVPLTTRIFDLRDSWRYILGIHYNVSPKLTVRAAMAYDQEPNNSAFQLAPKDNLFFGGNATYWVKKNFGVELAYFYVTYPGQNVYIKGAANTAVGTVNGNRNTFAGKLIWNIG